ncbi:MULTISPECIES: F0F1 ATP synthase subunit gamma [Chromobacterium]|uniref:F0F1 ATP synthase subunit gamma n=1 Tax=Chromobacterium TaxID=535 RepID=UPI0006543166|nr:MULTISPECIES: F0F1 ATP synthase subunit gamma [Chromobacterium]KMN35229.1 ATP F0F1 synthase subunit gamma [Chromobacterium sp. LK1]MBN3002262.1 F0F1 ATP synthase subunit gamma [Chromobacterium alkanivorans]MCP1289652.1 F0F1 ATP synthase subunit gamma [Chromobacterium sp. S0633]MCS3803463.1 F-type H+-transporting ATPase subunit gamma [Chromobacterium alkanivorans]MCS3817427.1 F-type H+-transporting ATPase subunit gamma [Chromobacterium alkanivorans]
MAVGKEILTKIRSVQNTQKITRAMQMVATSKMRKTQERMRAARPYAEKVRTVMAHLAQANTDLEHPLLQSRDVVKRAGIILMTSDKGLCGGLNVNTLKRFFAQVKDLQDQGIEVDVCCLGQKGLAACQRARLNVVASATQLGDVPKMEKLIGPLTVLFKQYAEGELDALYIVYSRFINTMKQEPATEQLLPLTSEHMVVEHSHSWDYLYEPSALAVMEFLVKRYIESVVFEAMAENMASEQAARMVAMKSATDNAGNTIKQLRLVYNKARQAAITTELSEIVAGAAAV